MAYLQKSIDFTPFEPRAGPTGGEGDACPAPTMSFTMTSFGGSFFAIWDWGGEGIGGMEDGMVGNISWISALG